MPTAPKTFANRQEIILLICALGLEQKVGSKRYLGTCAPGPTGDAVPMAGGLGLPHLFWRERIVASLEWLKASHAPLSAISLSVSSSTICPCSIERTPASSARRIPATV